MFVYLHMMLSRYVSILIIAQSYIHNDVMMCTKCNANYRLHYTCKTLDNTLQGVANEQIYMAPIFIQII